MKLEVLDFASDSSPVLDLCHQNLVEILAHLQGICKRLYPSVDLSRARQCFSKQNQVNSNLSQVKDLLSLEL